MYFWTSKNSLEFLSSGIRIANILHARLRQKCNILKCDLFRCNLIASCNCDCGNYSESVDHFFLKIVPESNSTWEKRNLI
jgi:hypothetical protein